MSVSRPLGQVASVLAVAIDAVVVTIAIFGGDFEVVGSAVAALAAFALAIVGWRLRRRDGDPRTPRTVLVLTGLVALASVVAVVVVSFTLKIG